MAYTCWGWSKTEANYKTVTVEANSLFDAIIEASKEICVSHIE